MALQRAAGNSAVNALMAARLRFPGEQARSDIDGAPAGDAPGRAGRRHRREGAEGGEGPGVPVDLEGPAAAVGACGDHHRLRARCGAGEEAGAAQEPVPAESPLGKAAAKPAKPGGGPGAAHRPGDSGARRGG